MFEINPVIFRLKNGMRVVFVKTDAFVAHMGVMIKAGSRYESKEEEGLAHFVEHTIFKGTKNREAVEIFSELDSVGGELNAYTNKEELCIHASFRHNHLKVASSLLSDLMINPVFPSKEVEKERGVVEDEINSYLDSPGDRIQDEFEALLFKDHALGFNILGRKETLKTFDHEKLVQFAAKMFGSNNSVISVVGDYKIDELKMMLEKDFLDVRSTDSNNDFNAYEDTPEVFKLKETKSNYQSHILIGGVAPSYSKLDRRAMTLIANYLGGPALNSKLVLSIREKHGYAYNIEANFTPYSDVGYWSIYAGTDNKYVEDTMRLIYQELNDLRENGLSDEELESAKEQLKGHIALSLDSNMEIMFYLGKSVLLYDKIDSIEDIYKQVDEISHEDINSLSQQIFKKENISELIYEFS